ncbi:MAG TPA: DegT/DnrJ/EryC1/StrS family aminotransferase [Chitinophagaceae bacterium]|nr:DegT/DnrJ/EryC1/StrS family aminotransferase [Chitinophagaceae bacterium]
MQPIQMVDLKRQYLRIKPEIDQAILDVLDSTAFINGRPVQDFASALAAYMHVKYVIPCANGTDALQIALMALGLEPGDEVITPSFTFISTVEVIALLRLTPVFIDVDPRSYCLDTRLLEKAITKRTRAIIPVHLYGQSTDMEPLLEFAGQHALHIIEDNAQAIGSDYRFQNGQLVKTGSMGAVSCTSFFPSKNLGGYGDGGAMCTSDEALAQRLRMIANHGQRERYYHDIVGCNSRLDTLQAAVLSVKLRFLDRYIDARIRVADGYDRAFAGHSRIITPYRAPNTRHVFHQYTLQIEGGGRDQLQQYLAGQGIPSMIYYPVPAHRQKMFASFGAGDAVLPVTDRLSERVLSLPIHTEMEEDQLEFIISRVLDFFH